jgi:hypothetical protein
VAEQNQLPGLKSSGSPLASYLAANELRRSVAQTFCLPYRRLAACKVSEGNVHPLSLARDHLLHSLVLHNAVGRKNAAPIRVRINDRAAADNAPRVQDGVTAHLSMVAQ